ncbi:helix-turn-helix domain-containing protein [Edaphovirga cremea]|uniref:helix-turn-helix domain-containing protein n=1 Tax=Edaphovirga cremea TaxID=2267246 RepID=UPI00398971CC
MSMDLMVQAMKLKVGNPLRKLVLVKLADNASDQGECWPAIRYVAQQCEISERSVQNHIKQLVKDGLLRVEERKAANGLNRSNIYYLMLKKRGENPAPSAVVPAFPGVTPASAGVTPAPSGVAPAPIGATPAPTMGANAAPRTNHSLDPVIDPVTGTDGGIAEESEGKKKSYPDAFETLWAIYPQREGNNSKQAAFNSWNARRKEGVPADHLLSGMIRYADYCQIKGLGGTVYVMQGSRFFGTRREYENSWAIAVSQSPRRPKDTVDDLRGRNFETLIGWKTPKGESADG